MKAPQSPSPAQPVVADPESPPPARQIHPELAERVQAELGQNVYLCYQCVKCSSGCPVAEYMDWQPNQIMRLLQLGQEDLVLKAKTPWLCASCQTCTTRCPQGLDIAGIMDYLTRLALQRGERPPVSEVKIFGEAFLREVRLWGRAYELGLMAEMKLRTHNLTGDLDLGLRMLRKNKMPFLPHPVRPPRRARPLAGASRKVAYYPGCSLHSTATEFNRSTQAVCQALGIELVEPAGWVCCGSSAAHRLDPQAALQLPMENLALIEQSGFQEVTMPCAACFNRHKAALFEIRHDRQKRQQVEARLDYAYQDRVRVNTLTQTIHQRLGAEKLAEQVRQPLSGLRVVCYYGCLLTRPPQVTEAPQPENPTDMDDLLRAAGAQVLDWSYKTTCCGAAHSLTRPDIVLDLSRRLIEQARLAGAEAIAVACPLCHTNLDARQFQMKLAQPLPVLYFTQLLVLALGLPPEQAALKKNLVDPLPLLHKHGLLPSPAAD